MADDTLYRLLSTESDIPRPRVLCTGSLERCLDEMKEAALIDAVACNRGTLTIVAVFEALDDPRRRIDLPLMVLTTSGNPA